MNNDNNENSNLGSMIKLTTITTTEMYPVLGKLTDIWIPIYAFNGDWTATPNVSFDIMVENSLCKAVSRSFPASGSTGGCIANDTRTKRLYILWINKSLLK